MTGPDADPLVGASAIAGNAWDCLLDVYDPELGIDVVNLGLIYGLRVEDGVAVVTMTLTTPGCPMGGSIPDQVRFSVGTLPGVKEAQVELVWDPPWEPEMMSDAARHALGWR